MEACLLWEIFALEYQSTTVAQQEVSVTAASDPHCSLTDSSPASRHSPSAEMGPWNQLVDYCHTGNLSLSS